MLSRVYFWEIKIDGYERKILIGIRGYMDR